MPEEDPKKVDIIKRKAKNFGTQWVFNMYVVMNRKQIVARIRKMMESIKTEDVVPNVEKGIYPPIPANLFSDLSEYYDRIKAIPLITEDDDKLSFAKFVAEARPDIHQQLEGMGEAGATYMANLRGNFLECVKNPEKAPVTAADLTAKKKSDMVNAVCDKCGKSWPVLKAEFSKIKECPFCKDKV